MSMATSVLEYTIEHLIRPSDRKELVKRFRRVSNARERFVPTHTQSKQDDYEWQSTERHELAKAIARHVWEEKKAAEVAAGLSHESEIQAWDGLSENYKGRKIYQAHCLIQMLVEIDG